MLVTAAGLLLAGLLALRLDWGPEVPSGPVELAPPASSGEPAQSLDGHELERGIPVRTNPDPTLTYWKDVPDIEAAFLAEFDACFIGRDGEGKATAKVLANQQSIADMDEGKRLAVIIGVFKEGTQPVKEINETMYAELIVGAANPAANLLTRHMNNYQSWVEEKKEPGYLLPEEKILRRPLDYPPEMIVAFWTGQPAGVDLPAELCSALAYTRDQHIIQHAYLSQELFIMGSCIEETIRALKIQIPADEKKEALRSFVPAYRRLLDEMDAVPSSYMQRIQFQARDGGLTVVR